jgi:hypothetical protein
MLMKYALILLFASMASASEGTITVRQGASVKVYSTAEYVVVKRIKHHKKPEPVVVVVPEPVPAPIKKNRVRLVGGIGPNGVTTSGGPQTYTVSPSEQFVGGVGYNRLVSGPWSVDAQALSNKTFTLGVGLDF